MSYRNIDVNELIEENERLKFINQARKDKLRFYLKWMKVFFRSRSHTAVSSKTTPKRSLGKFLNDILVKIVESILGIFLQEDTYNDRIVVTPITIALFVLGTFFGIGYLLTHPISCAEDSFRAGYVVSKVYHREYNTTTHHHPERFEVVFSNGEQTKSLDVSESSWHNYQMGSWTCLTPGNCPRPHDDDPADR